MKRVCLIRHSDAESIKKVEDDLQRLLTKKGKRETKIVADNLVGVENYQCNLIVCSSALRAFETAKIIASAYSIPEEFIHIEEMLYQPAGSSDFFSNFTNYNNAIDNVILIGHNPSLTELLFDIFNTAEIDMKKSSAVCIDFDVESWKEVDKSCAKMNFYKFIKNDELSDTEKFILKSDKKDVLNKLESAITGSIINSLSAGDTFSKKFYKECRSTVKKAYKTAEIVTIRDLSVFAKAAEAVKEKEFLNEEKKLAKIKEKMERADNKISEKDREEQRKIHNKLKKLEADKEEIENKIKSLLNNDGINPENING